MGGGGGGTVQERGEARERGGKREGKGNPRGERNREQASSKRTPSMYDMITKRGRDHYRPL